MDPSGESAHARHGVAAPPADSEHAPADRAQARGLATAERGLRLEAEPTIAGQRQVFLTQYRSATSDEDLRELQAVLDSIHIET